MSLTRRSFLAMSAALPFALKAHAASSSVPIGLELYSVRDALAKDLEGTVRAVARMGYQCVEFYAPYFEWNEARAKEVRKLLDDLGIHCYSTHNDEDFFSAKNLDRARDLNLILGSKYMVQAWSGPKPDLEAWKSLAEKLNTIAEKLESSGLKVGYHNHDAEWRLVNGQRP